MTERLPANLEAGAIIRRVEAAGGFAAVLHKGDPDRGALMLLIRDRGSFSGLLERTMGADFRYSWSLSNAGETLDSAAVDKIVQSRRRFDPDLWLIELDIAQPERFIAETIASG